MAKFYTQKLITTYHCEFAGLGLPRGLLVELRGRAETIMERKGTKREKHGGIKWPPLSITAQLLYMESLILSHAGCFQSSRSEVCQLVRSNGDKIKESVVHRALCTCCVCSYWRMIDSCLNARLKEQRGDKKSLLD